MLILIQAILKQSINNKMVDLNDRCPLWELFIVIFKLGFRRAFDGRVNGNTENYKCIQFFHVFAFFFRGNKKSVHQVQVAMYNAIF